MAEQKRDKYEESATSSNENPYYNPGFDANHVSRNSNGGMPDKRSEESIIAVDCFNQLQSLNYTFHMPFWQPVQSYKSILFHRNLPQAVLQQHLRQNYFHRPFYENQRSLHNVVNTNVGEYSIEKLRYWEKLAEHKKSGLIFTVMSYNVLAQDLLDQHPYLYATHEKKKLKWQVRWNNLIKEIQQFKPDIVCLQEVQNSHVNSYFSSALVEFGYEGVYKQRTGVHTDGCAIYYKRSLLSLAEHITVEYNQPHVRILDRDNVAVIVKFALRSNPDKEFVVATTHLLYNPKRQDVRLAQTQLLLTELDRIAFNNKNQYLPVIVTGDFNSSPNSAVYKFITKGKLKYENLCSRSLQSEGAGSKTGKQFLPPYLRVTDQCQHADLSTKRGNNIHVPRSEELKLIELKHSEQKPIQMNKENFNKKDSHLFASGTLTHNFFLKSVYQHLVNGDQEATTFQEEWISVDYIFFSKPSGNVDRLLLLERYRLPTKRELGNLKIPNTNLGSDHLSLLAKFQLQT